MAAELGMHFLPKLSWDEEVSPVRDRNLVRRTTRLPHVTRSEHRETTGRDYMHGLCAQLWRAPVFNWDGKMLGCSRNFWGDFGANVLDGGVDVAMKAERVRHAREMLRGRAEPREGIPCTTCEMYLGMRESGAWLGDAEVAAREPKV